MQTLSRCHLLQRRLLLYICGNEFWYYRSCVNGHRNECECEWHTASHWEWVLSVNTTSCGNDLHASSFFIRTPLKLIHWLLFWLLKGLAQLKLGSLNQPENLFSYLPALDLKLEESIQRTYWGFRTMVTFGGWGGLCIARRRQWRWKTSNLILCTSLTPFGLSIYSSPVSSL